MIDETSEETASLLQKSKRICMWISRIMKLAFGFLCIWWIYTSSLMAMAIMQQSTLNIAQDVSLSSLIVYILHGLIVLVICFSLIKIFSDSAKGESPFTMIQVKRLRIIAAMLVLYSVTEFAVSFGAAFMKVDGLGFGYAALNSNPMVTYNLAPIIAAIALLAFSSVFKYGVLLQEFSDETI